MMFLILLGLVAALLCVYVFKVPKEIQHIPAIPLWSTLVSMYKGEPLDQVNTKVHQEILNKYGMARMWMGKWIVLVTDEDALKDIYNNIDDYPMYLVNKDYPNFALFKLIGDSFYFANGKEWKAKRKPFNSVINRTWNPEIFASTIKRFMNVIDQNEDQTIPVSEYMKKLSMEVIGNFFFGVDFNSIQNPSVEFIQRYQNVISSTFTFSNILFPTLDREWNPLKKQSHLDVKWFQEQFNQMCKEKKESPKEDSDLLTSMILHSDDYDQDFVKNIIANFMGFFITGYDTTSTALSISLHFLAKYPEIQEKCRKEIKEKVKGEVPTLEELKQLEYLNCVIKESMRVCPTSPMSSEKINKKVLKVRDSYIPKNSHLVVYTLALHRNGNVFKDPLKFKPERFLDKNYGVNFAPFGFGPRKCIGLNFVITEMRIILAMLIRKYYIYYEDTKEDSSLLINGISPITQIGPVNLKFKAL